MFLKILSLFALLIWQTNGAALNYKICVPHKIMPACNELMGKRSESDSAIISCVPGRDRLNCLEMIIAREADFLVTDPEDMYLAFNMKNEDFAAFADIRTVEENQAEFRYEGIILIKKNSGINSLQGLRGKKSCHTGYGRNVGFKIPIAKLKNKGVFKADPDLTLSPVERELKALSEMFSQSCLVGSYSPNPEVDQALKKKYSNLCALCEKPEQCHYPDNLSGYDGSIRCLEKAGDVAFTKVIFVNRHFGLPIGMNPNPSTVAQGNPDDYEYLCEDGTKKPITGKACSWAQRPWQTFLGNGDIKHKQLKALQAQLESFYEKAKTASNKVFAEQMLVKDTQQVVPRETPIFPGNHLTNAQYKDVIERSLVDSNSPDEKLKWCVSSLVESRKCEALKAVAYSRDIRPTFECVMKSKTECESAIEAGDLDIFAVQPNDYLNQKRAYSKPIMYETFDVNDVFVVVAKKFTKAEILKKGTIKFDTSDLRSENAALFFNQVRITKQCPGAIQMDENAALEVINAKNIDFSQTDKELVCKDFSRKPLEDFKTCNFDFTLPTAIFARNDAKSYKIDSIKHAFTSLSDKFGSKGKFEGVFELFGEFEPGQKNVLFSDSAVAFKTEKPSNFDEGKYKELRCA